LQRHAVNLPVIAPTPQQVESNTWGTGTIIEELNDFLTPAHLVIADTGDCLFASVELRADQFIASGYYASMGLSIPGAISAALARPEFRPIVLVGDGAFKMNGVELGTAADWNLSPIIVLLNNRSFATLKATDKERDYYRVRSWDYVGMARCLGGRGVQVKNRAEFRQALRNAQQASVFTVIDAFLPEGDASPTLQRLGRDYGGQIRMNSQ
jgi:indolepyruvate decarboxylase